MPLGQQSANQNWINSLNNLEIFCIKPSLKWTAPFFFVFVAFIILFKSNYWKYCHNYFRFLPSGIQRNYIYCRTEHVKNLFFLLDNPDQQAMQCPFFNFAMVWTVFELVLVLRNWFTQQLLLLLLRLWFCWGFLCKRFCVYFGAWSLIIFHVHSCYQFELNSCIDKA